MKSYYKNRIAVIFGLLLLATSIFAKGLVNEEEIKAKLPKMLGANNVGKEFWFTVPPCYEDESGGYDNFIRVFITSPVKTLVTVEIPRYGFQQSQYTIPNDVIHFELTPTLAQPWTKKGPDAPPAETVVREAGVHITSDAPVVVYCVVRYYATSDGCLCLPISSWGKEYIAAPYQEEKMYYPGIKFPAMVGVVAGYDNTTMKFTMGGTVSSQTAGGITSGLTKAFVMQKGDVVMFASNGGFQELCGSKIIASKPVGVVSGVHCTNIPVGNTWCDYTIETDHPTYTWGTDYHIPKVPRRLYPSIIRVFAKEPNTKIYRNGNHIGNIAQAGGVYGKAWLEMRVVPIEQGPQSAVYSGDKPINVVFYNPGMLEDMLLGSDADSDPFAMAMTPIQQYQKEITFCTPGIRGKYGFKYNYINLVYQTDEDGYIPEDLEFAEVISGNFDWKPVKVKYSGADELFSHDVDGKKYAVKSITLPGDGVYKIRGEKPFAAYSFGYAHCDSYGYPTSAALADLEKPDTLAPDPQWSFECDGTVAGTITDKPDDAEVRSNLSMIVYDNENSYNYTFTYTDFVAGETITTNWALEVVNKNKDALAIITFTDRSGNDTTIFIEYHAVKLEIKNSPVDFGMLKKGQVVDVKFWAINRTEFAPVTIEFFRLKFGNVGFELLDENKNPITVPPSGQFEIPTLDSIPFWVRFTATTAGEFKDSIYIEDTCYHNAGAFVEAVVGEPVINVSDIHFGSVSVGTPVKKSAEIRNTGNVDLFITNYSGPSNGGVYKIVDDKLKKDIIDAGGLILKPNAEPYMFQVEFTPAEEKDYPDQIVFSSDANKIDSICLITGTGIKADLISTSITWPRLRIDRPKFPAGPYDVSYSTEQEGIRLTNSGSQEVVITDFEVEAGSDINNPVFEFDRDAFKTSLAAGESKTFTVKFHPKTVGEHKLVFGFKNTAGSITKTTLIGYGIMPKIKTTDYDFGSTILADYINPPNIREVIFENMNWDWEDTLTISNLVALPATSIKGDGGALNDANNYGDKGYMYDKAVFKKLPSGTEVNGFPVHLQPGEKLQVTSYFIAKQVDPAAVSLTTDCDAEENVTSNWTGSGVSLGIDAVGDTASLCYGESYPLKVKITNTAAGDIKVDSIIVVGGLLPSDMIMTPADIALFESGFTLKAGESKEFTISYLTNNGTTKNGSTLVELKVYNSTYNDPIKSLWLQGNVTYKERVLSISTDKPNVAIPLPVKCTIRLNPGESITEAAVKKLKIKVSYQYGILKLDPQSAVSLRNGFTLETPVPKETGTSGSVEFVLVSNGEVLNDVGGCDLLSFSFLTFLPTGRDTIDASLIKIESVVADEDNKCIGLTGNETKVQLTGGCVYDMRWLAGGSSNYYFNKVAPNPIKDNGVLEFGIGLDGSSQLMLINMNGEVVKYLVDGVLKAGDYKINIPVEELNSGVYNCTLIAGPYKATRQLVIAK